MSFRLTYAAQPLTGAIWCLLCFAKPLLFPFCLSYGIFAFLFKHGGSAWLSLTLLHRIMVAWRRACSEVWMSLRWPHTPSLLSLLVCRCHILRLWGIDDPVDVCVCEAWAHAAESCRGLWRDAFPLLTKPWLALDWWGRSCLCSLIHHALYLDFGGKGKKDRIKEKRLPEISE